MKTRVALADFYLCINAYKKYSVTTRFGLVLLPLVLKCTLNSTGSLTHSNSVCK